MIKNIGCRTVTVTAWIDGDSFMTPYGDCLNKASTTYIIHTFIHHTFYREANGQHIELASQLFKTMNRGKQGDGGIGSRTTI